MKKVACILVFIIASSAGSYCQKSTIVKILGRASVNASPIVNRVEITFSENGVTCGPNTNYETVHDQFEHFKSKLSELGLYGVEFVEEKKPQNIFQQNKTITYSAVLENSEKASIYYEAAGFAFADRVDFYGIYPEAEIEDNHTAALMALKDAKKRVEVIKKILGKKESKLLSIDDATTYFGGPIYGINLYHESRKFPIEIGSKTKISYRYFLYVTYELN